MPARAHKVNASMAGRPAPCAGHRPILQTTADLGVTCIKCGRPWRPRRRQAGPGDVDELAQAMVRFMLDERPLRGARRHRSAR